MAAAVISIFLFATLILATVSLYISREAISVKDLRPSRIDIYSASISANHQQRVVTGRRHVFSVNDRVIQSDSVLFPEWIVFVIVDDSHFINSNGDRDGVEYQCVFQNNATSPANYVTTLHVTNRRSYKCVMPSSVRRLRPFLAPVLTKLEVKSTDLALDWTSSRSYLKRWTFLVYDSISTADDVIVFAKGVNRPGRVYSPASLRCVFTDEVSNQQVRSLVTSSEQEIFRCSHPAAVLEGSTIIIALETLDELNQHIINSVPSVALYSRFRNETTKTMSFKSSSSSASKLCACTMVHNVGKFLKEWVMYHSSIGVEKFVLYDNDSDEEDGNLRTVATELIEAGYNTETIFWPWPKSQEAGFSHSVISSKTSCKWMMFMDVDEFLISPNWLKSQNPSSAMLHSLLPRLGIRGTLPVGQVKIQCHDFGPSNQTIHPKNGVTQGYTCRRKKVERHKSIVLLEAVDDSLQNSVHHFRIRAGVYRTETLRIEKAVVNHYKFQVWSEFKTKFKRRVSTYVTDWTQNVNMMSKDRTPGLGVEAVEPEGWAMKFCEVVDTRLKLLTQKWFGFGTGDNRSEIRMAWER